MWWANEELNPGVPSVVVGTGCLNPNRGSIVVRGNRGDSVYHGLQAELRRSVGRLTVLEAYTFSRAIDNASEVFTTSGGSSFWEVTNDPRSDRGPSAFDHKHRATITWVYDFPSPTIQVLFTGVTLPVTANQVRYIAFNFASGRNGNLRRNSFYLPGTETYNLSAIKRFKLPFRENQIEFRADFFNAFNHPNEGVNVTNYGDLLNPAVFGNPRTTLSGARQIQLWLKYSF